MRVFVFLLLFSLSFESYSFMNIENLRRGQKTGLHGNGSLRLSGALGNTDKFISDTSVSNFYKTKKSEWLLFLNHMYGKAFKEKNADKGKAHLRYTLSLNDQWGLESFTQGEYNDFQRLSSRFIYGQALRYRALDSEERSLYLGFGAFYEWENINSTGDGLIQRRIENLRANLYISYHRNIKNRDTFFMTLYFQPFRASDYRFLFSSGYRIPLGKYLSLSLEVNYNYDSKPPQEILRTDFIYFTALSYIY